KWRPKRMVKSKMSLPVTEKGEPNWEYMENYIKEEKQKNKLKTIQFLENELAKIRNYKNFHIDNINWKVFILGEVCTIKNSVRLTKKDMLNGLRPFIGASDAN